ncbi:hypothetical protein BJ878DRAFT_540605 [Calycina marina]|uniref:Uncharacterized protein n=1 Tax=Calycina marina TaxID=1763456 RepID=A0A9P8CGR0_9HELO|nr:hypothetical protein BJ878DRAFT_540605 [Calycina marina]
MAAQTYYQGQGYEQYPPQQNGGYHQGYQQQGGYPQQPQNSYGGQGGYQQQGMQYQQPQQQQQQYQQQAPKKSGRGMQTGLLYNCPTLTQRCRTAG